ncbi:helix-turn-helix domain-containing protein [Streptomyces sp. 7-21]|uniref:helix-turn-helix domain-containing protein n=1 Tax=Streptomyces sp. 7-21 TaxID=2802283 RepID=UPI00191E7116|nr:helix-turn-helix domain-containing protein [Streptomyces sp. 7-21]MBL1068717.1 helix-turn-helix transcriptional regulator [Streptomyces sp. 7-21]
MRGQSEPGPGPAAGGSGTRPGDPGGQGGGSRGEASRLSTGNRARILRAARQELAEHGYEGASLRGVARRARVDLRLVHHYFGRKNHLAHAATQPARAAGSRFRHGLLAAWDADPLGWRALIAAAMTHEPARSRLLTLLARLRGACPPAPGPHQPQLRRAAATSQLLGLALLGEAGTLAATGEPGGGAYSRRVAGALDAYLHACTASPASMASPASTASPGGRASVPAAGRPRG